MVAVSLAAACTDDPACEPYVDIVCEDGLVFWIDGCGNAQDVEEVCAHGCAPSGAFCQEACEPSTCAAAALVCGEHSDGCGGVLKCGECPDGQWCDAQGQCNVENCDPGWSGPGCAVPVCDPVCRNQGECVAPNTCSCAAGWTGAVCERPRCDPPCANGGTCIGPLTCRCTDDWGGDTCTIAAGPRELVNGAVAKVGHIIDGDTLDVYVGDINPKRYTIRLVGLAAPECLKENVQTAYGYRWQCNADDEFYGLKSWEGLVDFAAEKSVVITCDNTPVGQWCPTDDFDRYLAYVAVAGRDAATEMAWRGLGMSYTVFSATKRAAICAAEYDAQANKRGMWAHGTVRQVVEMMSSQTQSWYFAHHDRRCDAALGN